MGNPDEALGKVEQMPVDDIFDDEDITKPITKTVPQGPTSITQFGEVGMPDKQIPLGDSKMNPARTTLKFGEKNSKEALDKMSNGLEEIAEVDSKLEEDSALDKMSNGLEQIVEVDPELEEDSDQYDDNVWEPADPE